MVGDINKFAIANLALSPLYAPLIAIVMASDSLGMHSNIMDSVILTASYTGISAFIFPIAASALTALTQDTRFLALDLVPPIILGGSALAIQLLNRRV